MNKFILIFGIVLVASLLFLSELAVNKSEEIEKPYPKAPELAGISGYINAENISISDLKGKVVLVDFWTYSCINCLRTLPHLIRWNDMYKDKGLVIIGVHTPEFDFEKDINNVRGAVKKYGVNYPVVLDNDYATWRAYQNRYWPHKFLIDKDGYIRYHHIGEGGYDETEGVIKALLLESGQDTSDVKESTLLDDTPNRPLTPELYAGLDYALPRDQNLGNDEGFKVGKSVNYTLPEEIKQHEIYLSGNWIADSNSLTALGEGEIVLRFLAGSVNIVVDNTENTTSTIVVDDEIIDNNQASDVSNFVLVTDSPRLYNIYSGDYGYHKITIKVKEGFSFNAFTFG